MRAFASTIVFWSTTSGSFKGPTGLFISFPAKKQIDGTHWDLAFPANAETRNMIQRAILAEYEKIVAGRDPVPSEKQRADAK